MVAVTLEPARLAGSKRMSAFQRRKAPENASPFMVLPKRTAEAALSTVQAGAGAARAAVASDSRTRRVGRHFMPCGS